MDDHWFAAWAAIRALLGLCYCIQYYGNVWCKALNMFNFLQHNTYVWQYGDISHNVWDASQVVDDD